MIGFNDAAMVNCYFDFTALLTMLLLLILQRRSRTDLSLRIISWMNIALTITCAASFLCHLMQEQEFPWCHGPLMAARSLWEWLSFVIILLWGGYVQNKLYADVRRFSGPRTLMLLPFIAFTVLLVINPLTGVLFTYSEDYVFEAAPLFMPTLLIRAIYFVATLFRVWAYDRKSTRIRFLKVLPMLMPVGSGMMVQVFLPYQADVLGFAIGAVLVYFSLAEEARVVDEESGLYSKGFLTYLIDQALHGNATTDSALILKADGDLPSSFRIVRDTLSPVGDVIRMEEKRFLMFLTIDSRSELQLLSTRLEEAVDQHNTEHPDRTVRIRTLARMRRADEDMLSFLRETVEDQDAGDPVRGVASMISELTQLDNELKLAGDIQQSILPMNFPAFPDRKEFDLYASVDPAKEVGGDFYDFFLVDRDHLALVIADVSGKGVPAALFMMVSKTLIKNQLMEGNDPASTLKSVNKQLCERNSSMMFVTVWLAVIEISTGKGLACNAGHEKPALYRAGSGFELLKYRHCRLVGLDEEAVYENREFELHRGESVLVYTDGVPEATDAAGQMFGDDRLVECLNEDADTDPEEVIRRVRESVDRFVNGAPQFDDITMLCLKYNGTEGKDNG